MSASKARKFIHHFEYDGPNPVPTDESLAEFEQLVLSLANTVATVGGTLAFAAVRQPVGEDHYVTAAVEFEYRSYAPLPKAPESSNGQPPVDEDTPDEPEDLVPPVQPEPVGQEA